MRRDTEGSSHHIFIVTMLEFALTHSENYEKAQPGLSHGLASPKYNSGTFLLQLTLLVVVNQIILCQTKTVNI